MYNDLSRFQHQFDAARLRSLDKYSGPTKNEESQMGKTGFSISNSWI